MPPWSTYEVGVQGKVAPTADSSDDDADSEEEADPEQANKTATTSNSDVRVAEDGSRIPRVDSRVGCSGSNPR
jgi:hypothetical protein